MDAILSSAGRITLPKAVRDRLHLSAGDRLAVVVEADGSVRLRPQTHSVRDLKGSLPRPATPVSLEELDAAIAEGAADSTAETGGILAALRRSPLVGAALDLSREDAGE